MFWRFAFLWLAVWTILPWLLMPSPGTLDVIEQFIIGREWVLGSIHHPPLPFWIQEIMYQICGRSMISCYFCGALTSFLGIWAVWRLSRYYVNETYALLIVLASAAYRYFNIGNVNFTTNAPPVSLWCLAIFLLFRAVKYNRLGDWLWLGIALGAGMMSKYSVGILVLTMVLYLCLEPKVRRLWCSPGPWLTSFCAVIIFLPHLCWMIHYDFPTIKYAAHSLSGNSSAWNHLITPLRFFGSQLFFILPMIVPLIPLLGFCWQLKRRRPLPDAVDFDDDLFRNRFLTFMFFLPIVIQLGIFAACGGGRMRPAYGSPLWTLTALWFVQFFQIIPGKIAIKRTAILAFVVLIVTVFAFWFDYQFRYCFTKDPCRSDFPAKALGTKLDEIWARRFGPAPCPYLSGDWKVVGHAALHMKGRPSVLCYYHGTEPGKHPDGFWVFDEDLDRDGGMIVWKSGTGQPPDDVPEYLKRRFPRAVVAPDTLSIPWLTKADIEPLNLRYAIIEPKKK
ncbi:MAG: glycosyltransferase family 39 protein [Thermoguttaceae bacterium]|nr:glycosyltransferase family 39 protein [Thermoguttaceae bacterium]